MNHLVYLIALNFLKLNGIRNNEKNSKNIKDLEINAPKILSNMEKSNMNSIVSDKNNDYITKDVNKGSNVNSKRALNGKDKILGIDDEVFQNRTKRSKNELGNDCNDLTSATNLEEYNTNTCENINNLDKEENEKEDENLKIMDAKEDANKYEEKNSDENIVIFYK